MKNIIINYINNMTIDDINNFAIKNSIYLNNIELNFIYDYIKDNYNSLLDNPNNFDISIYKNTFSEENYIKINNLINEYKKKITNL